MTIKLKTIDELEALAKAGAGFRMDCVRKSADELIRLASAAKESGSQIFMHGIHLKSSEELLMIAEAAKGSVVFEDRA